MSNTPDAQSQFTAGAAAAPAKDLSLTWRFSDSTDVASVLKFYADNQHEHVENSGEAHYTDRITSGRTLIIEDQDGSIKVASMAHYDPYMKAVGQVVIGSTMSILQGCELEPLKCRPYVGIIASQVVERFLVEPPTDCFFAMIWKKAEFDRVTEMLHREVGWPIVTVSQQFADAVDEGPNLDKQHWLQATSRTLPHQARIVLRLLDDDATIIKHKTQERYKLDFSRFSLANAVYRPLIQELAHGKFGKMLESAPAIPMRHVHDLLMNYAGPAAPACKP